MTESSGGDIYKKKKKNCKGLFRLFFSQITPPMIRSQAISCSLATLIAEEMCVYACRGRCEILERKTYFCHKHSNQLHATISINITSNKGGQSSIGVIHTCTTDSYSRTEIAHAKADACRHDKHSRHSRNTRRKQRQCVCAHLHITTGGAMIPCQQPVRRSLWGGGAGFSG